MGWVRIDDHFTDHPKLAAAGPLAGWLHVCGLCYCNRHLTDGFIPKAVAHRLAHFEHIGVSTGGSELYEVGQDADCEWMASILCHHGVWKQVPGGYLVHDYLEYQPSKAEVEEMTRQKKAAGQAGGQASARARAQAKLKQRGKQNPTPNPNPNIKPGAVRSEGTYEQHLEYPELRAIQ